MDGCCLGRICLHHQQYVSLASLIGLTRSAAPACVCSGLDGPIHTSTVHRVFVMVCHWNNRFDASPLCRVSAHPNIRTHGGSRCIRSTSAHRVRAGRAKACSGQAIPIVAKGVCRRDVLDQFCDSGGLDLLGLDRSMDRSILLALGHWLCQSPQ